jgi:hypothetical protein
MRDYIRPGNSAKILASFLCTPLEDILASKLRYGDNGVYLIDGTYYCVPKRGGKPCSARYFDWNPTAQYMERIVYVAVYNKKFHFQPDEPVF